MPKPETLLIASIIQYLKMRGHLCKRNQSGLMTRNYKGKTHYIHMGESGWSDIIGCLGQKIGNWPVGTFFAIEVKTIIGKTTPSQDMFLDEVKKRGAISLVARDVDDVTKYGF